MIFNSMTTGGDSVNDIQVNNYIDLTGYDVLKNLKTTTSITWNPTANDNESEYLVILGSNSGAGQTSSTAIPVCNMNLKINNVLEAFNLSGAAGEITAYKFKGVLPADQWTFSYGTFFVLRKK